MMQRTMLTTTGLPTLSLDQKDNDSKPLSNVSAQDSKIISTEDQGQIQKFDLTQLKEFNPALVYEFDPEASIQQLERNTLEYLLHETGQYEDMFNAYLYAQDTILPAIAQTSIANITPEQCLNWLNELHFLIARSIVYR